MLKFLPAARKCAQEGNAKALVAGAARGSNDEARALLDILELLVGSDGGGAVSNVSVRELPPGDGQEPPPANHGRRSPVCGAGGAGAGSGASTSIASEGSSSSTSNGVPLLRDDDIEYDETGGTRKAFAEGGFGKVFKAE